MAPHGFGWRRDRVDHRDLLLHEQVRLPAVDTLPAAVDLRTTGHLADPIFDQGSLGSCTANAIAGALLYVQHALGLEPRVTPARLALYYWERVIEGTASDDAGAEIRDGLKVVAGKPGYVDESLWPYDVDKFADDPGQAIALDAAPNHATKYMRVNVSAAAMKQALAAGFPVVIGFNCYQEIESDQVARTGYLPRPARGEQPIGGHAVLLVGYDDARQRWICRNSWGADWGMGGYFETDYGYLDSSTYASDFWVVQAEVEGGSPAPNPPAPTDPLHELAALLRQFTTDVGAWLQRHGL